MGMSGSMDGKLLLNSYRKSQAHHCGTFVDDQIEVTSHLYTSR